MSVNQVPSPEMNEPRRPRRGRQSETFLAGCIACPNRKPGWFCSLGDAVLADLDVVTTPRLLAPGERLFNQGENADRLYIICGGYLKLTADSPHGKTMILRVAGPGAILGLHAAMSERPYEVTAETLQSAHVRAVHKSDFLGFLRRHKEAQIRVVQCICQEYRFALQDACRIALTDTVAARLARLLAELAQQIGEWHDGEYRIPLLLTHEELASMTCTTRETVTRTLGQFKKDGILSIRDSAVTVHQPERLQGMF